MSNKVLSNIAIGKFIREKRVELGCSQEELASMLGISKTAVSNWENGNAIVDVKFLIPLSNIFSVQVDEILFPQSGDSAEYNYSDYTILFQKVTSFKERDPLICKKMLDMYVDCKIKLLELIREYKKAPTDEIWQAIVQTNKFGFYPALGRKELDSYNFNERRLEDTLETEWGPMFFCNIEQEDDNSPQSQIPHLFLEDVVMHFSHPDDEYGMAMSDQKSMLNFVFFVGGERIFRKYIATFSKEYRDRLLYDLVWVFVKKQTKAFSKDETRAMKALLREGAELWNNGENLTDYLMRKLL